MSGWTTEMAAAIPDNGEVDQTGVPVTQAVDPAAAGNRAQEHGWAPKIHYDYDAYNKSNKQLMEDQAAFLGENDEDIGIGGLVRGQWHSNVRFLSLSEVVFSTSMSKSFRKMLTPSLFRRRSTSGRMSMEMLVPNFPNWRNNCLVPRTTSVLASISRRKSQHSLVDWLLTKFCKHHQARSRPGG